MHRIRSTRSRKGSIASNGVSGLAARPDPETEVAHLGDQCSGLTDLDVHGAAVGPGVAEGLEVAGRLGDHQVGVEEQVGMVPEGCHHGRADRQVGDEVPVHHIDVEPVGSRRDLVDGVGQGPEVGGEDRRGHPHLGHDGRRHHGDRAYRRHRSGRRPPVGSLPQPLPGSGTDAP